MYLRGEGIGKNKESGFNCLKMAAERGNVYAQGRLVEFYYKNKLYTKSCDLAKKFVSIVLFDAFVLVKFCDHLTNKYCFVFFNLVSSY